MKTKQPAPVSPLKGMMDGAKRLGYPVKSANQYGVKANNLPIFLNPKAKKSK